MDNLPDWPALEKKFTDAGYKIEVDLSNTPVIEKGEDYQEYDELPDDLKKALDKFAEDNNLN